LNGGGLSVTLIDMRVLATVVALVSFAAFADSALTSIDFATRRSASR
jgi:hypothetical protein